MKKVFKTLMSGLAVLVLGVGLAGCGNSKQSASQSSSDSTRSSKKASSSKKNVKAKKSSSSKNTTSKSDDEDTTSSSDDEAATTASSSQSTKAKTAAAKSSKSSSTSSSSKANQSSEIQLGLGDVAVWTDSQGITHHVDSDGMDRQTTSGSQQVQYQDWSGSLPSNATVQHNSTNNQ